MPIQRIARPIQKITTNKKITIKKQFLVQVACARTIHRSQGLTMEALAFDPTGIRQHGLTYTALSQTKSVDSLFLLQPLTTKNFKVKDKIQLEMSRLQTCAQWKLDNLNTCSKNKSHMLLCTLNTRSLKAHAEDIVNDYGIMQSDILCLQETHMHPFELNILL